jgi:DeoR/GlpR family transcriptional regulator of sugar metabolism
MPVAQPPALAEERRQRILEALAAEGRVYASELAARLAVSLDTVRRDLQELDDAGCLRRVRGGALPRATAVPAAFEQRRERARAAKGAIASAAAAPLLRAGEVVLLGGGTTLLELARRLPADARGTVITTSPDVALELVGRPEVEVVVAPGRLLADTRTVVGADAVAALRGIAADVCVLGTCSLDAEHGLSLMHREEAQVEREMLAGARRVVVLADAEKLGATAPFAVAPAGAIDEVVTDGAARDDVLAALRARGVEVTRA